MTGPFGNGSVSVAGAKMSSTMRPALTSIEACLEGLRANAAIGVQEAFIGLPQIRIGADDVFYRVHDAFRIEAGPQDFAQTGVFGSRAAEEKLVILHPFTVDAQNPDMSDMMMAAGINAA